MSEQAAEAPQGGGGGGGGMLKRKLGPFPMWAWLAIGAVIILAYVIIKRQSASSASGAGTSTADTSADASQIPQFVNQTYTTVTPPAAPTPSPSGGTTPPVIGTVPPIAVKPSPAKARPSQITASGTDMGDINQVAHTYGLTEQQLIAANPGLRKIKVRSPGGKSIPLIGSGAPIPKGTIIKIPPLPKAA